MTIFRFIGAIIAIMMIAGFLASIYLGYYLQAIILFLLIESTIVGNQLRRIEKTVNTILTSQYMNYIKGESNANSDNK